MVDCVGVVGAAGAFWSSACGAGIRMTVGFCAAACPIARLPGVGAVLLEGGGEELLGAAFGEEDVEGLWLC